MSREESAIQPKGVASRRESDYRPLSLAIALELTPNDTTTAKSLHCPKKKARTPRICCRDVTCYQQLSWEACRCPYIPGPADICCCKPISVSFGQRSAGSHQAEDDDRRRISVCRNPFVLGWIADRIARARFSSCGAASSPATGRRRNSKLLCVPDCSVGAASVMLTALVLAACSGDSVTG